MKKTILILLTGICLTLTGCSGSSSESTSSGTLTGVSAEPITTENSTEETSAASSAAPSVSSAASSEVSASAGTESSSDYSICTSLSAADVEAFASSAKAALLKSDWNTIASMCSYPITIDGTSYADENSLKKASITLSDTSISDLTAESCQNMFCNADGIMLGNGEVWISEVLDSQMNSEGLKIIAINDLQ